MSDLWYIAEQTIKGTPYRLQQFGSGNATDIMQAVLACQPDAQEQTRDFSSRLSRIYRNDRRRLLFDLYNAICKNVRLQYDPVGVQLVRKPSNIVAERACDCKSYSLFISAVLSNLGIKNFFRFVSFGPGKEITHVYIVADLDGKQYVMDCNLRSFGEETHYYKKIDKMARISAIGKVPAYNKTAWRAGRSLNQMSEPELALRLHRNELKSELNLKQVKQNPELYRRKCKQIEYEGDLLKTVQAATDKGGAFLEESEALIGAIEHDWKTGRYLSMSRKDLLRQRAQEWQNGTRYYSDSAIGGWLKNAVKKVGKAVKTVANTVGTAVVKTVKATGKAVVSSAKLAANITKMATIAPVAALTSKGREEIKKTAQDIKGNVIEQGQAIKTVTLAPVSALVEEVLDEMTEAGPYFFYYYVIPAEKLSLFPKAVQDKWAKQKDAYDRIIKYIDVDKSKLNSVIRESIQRQWGHTPEEVLKALITVRTRGKSDTDPSQIGIVISAAAIAVVKLIGAIATAAAAIVTLILKIVGAAKNKSEVSDGAASSSDWLQAVSAISNAVSGSTDDDGKFNFNAFAGSLLNNAGKSGNEKTATYANLLTSLSGLINKAGGTNENQDFYKTMLNTVQQAAKAAGGEAKNVTDSDLIKLINAMAKQDGIGDEFTKITSKLSNLENLSAAYAGALKDKYAVEEYLQLSSVTTPGASKLEDMVTSSKTTETPTASATVSASGAAGTAKAKSSIWPLVIGAGVIGGALLFTGNKKKKKKKNKK